MIIVFALFLLTLLVLTAVGTLGGLTLVLATLLVVANRKL